MADTPEIEPARQVSIDDPLFRATLATNERPIMVLDLERHVTIYNCDTIGLGDDHRDWYAFFDKVTGGDCDTVFRFSHSGHSYFCNTAEDRRADPERFNAVAAMLIASETRTPFQYGRPVFGPVILSGFNLRTYEPKPLDAEKLLSAWDAMVEQEKLAKAKIAELEAAEAASTES
jgi:hypothetical protein